MSGKKTEFYRIFYQEDFYKTIPVGEKDNGEDICRLGAQKINLERQNCHFQLYIVALVKEKETLFNVNKNDNVFKILEEVKDQNHEVDRLMFRVGSPHHNLVMRSKVFQHWADWMLTPKGMRVKDMGKSWNDGLLLLNLASVLMRRQIPETTYYKKPKNAAQRLHNINTGLQLFRHENACLGEEFAELIKKGNHETILNTLWAIIQTHYGAIFGLPKVSEFLFLEEMMVWIRQIRKELYSEKKSSNETDDDIKDDFVTVFCDTKTISSLLRLSSNESSSISGSPAEGVKKLFEVAEEQAGVPLLLDFGAFSDLKNVDDLSIVTYLSVFHQRTLNKERIIFSDRLNAARMKQTSPSPSPSISPPTSPSTSPTTTLPSSASSTSSEFTHSFTCSVTSSSSSSTNPMKMPRSLSSKQLNSKRRSLGESESKSSGRRPRFAPLGEKNSRKNRRQQRRKQHLDMGLEMLPTLKEKSEKGVEGEEGGREGVSSLSLSSSMDSLEKKGGGPMSARAPTAHSPPLHSTEFRRSSSPSRTSPNGKKERVGGEEEKKALKRYKSETMKENADLTLGDDLG